LAAEPVFKASTDIYLLCDKSNGYQGVQ
jgi:hypothetical protein